jgi:DNA transformation protein
VGSYWHLPERLYDDPEQLTDWARSALAAAQRAALRNPPKARKAAQKPAKPGMPKKNTARRGRHAT